MATSSPTVSVLLITYNHAPYIREAIESVIKQKTEFSFEVCIGDDGSTDGTTEICSEYARLYPDLVRHFVWDRTDSRRRGMQPAAFNGIQTMKQCRGGFLALIDGDDFWDDPTKLQRQVDYLNEHSGCTMVFSSHYRLVGDVRTLLSPSPCKPVYTLDDLLQGNLFQVCTALYRNMFKGDLPAWWTTAPFGDWALNILHALHGDIGYIDRPMAVYRATEQGMWAGANRVSRCVMKIEAGRILLRHLPATVSRRDLRAYVLSAQQELVYYGLVWGQEPSQGRRALVSLLLARQWPFKHAGDVFRALVWGVAPALGRFSQAYRERKRKDQQP